MELALTLLLGIVACLTCGLVALLVMPLSFRSQGSLVGLEASGWLQIGWAFGAIQVRAHSSQGIRLFILGIPVHRFEIKRPVKAHQAAQKKKKKKKSKSNTSNKVRSVWQKRSTLARAAKRMLTTLHLTGELQGRFGLGDPADMAWLAVLVMQIETRCERFCWAVQLDYTEEIIDLNGRIQAWIVPGQLLVVGLALFLRRDVRMALKI